MQWNVIPAVIALLRLLIKEIDNGIKTMKGMLAAAVIRCFNDIEISETHPSALKLYSSSGKVCPSTYV